MKKILFTFIILLLFTNCAGLYTKDNYRIKSIGNGYSYNSEYSRNRIYLTEPKGEDKWAKGRVTLSIEIPNYEIPNYNSDILIIKSYKENFFINGKWYESEKDKYNKPEILNDVVITKKNSKKIVIDKNKIRYRYKENPNTKFKEVWLYLPEILSGPITLELGRVKIGDKVYNVPKIYMQKYRVTESYSLLGSLLEEGGEHLPGYHSEGWIDD